MGLCDRCGEASVPGKTACRKHLDEAAARSARSDVRKRDNGVCLDCNEKVVPGKKFCSVHLEHRNHINSDKREKRRQHGLCEECGKEPIIGSGCCLGETCKYKSLARSRFGSGARWKDLKLVFERSPICPYTKIPLRIGVNASLDHVIPTSAGGGDDNENLQFVYCCGAFDVNMMKGAMTAMEFRAAIAILHKGMCENAV